jgi:hypothetical protein
MTKNTETTTDLENTDLDEVTGGASQGQNEAFLRKAYGAELEGQMELEQSGLGQPPGRHVGDFIHSPSFKAALKA